LIEEPPPPSPGKFLNLQIRPSRSIKFRYEDGPRDCESIAIDPRSQQIYLLSKRDRPTVLYQLPFREPKADEVMVAKRLGATTRIPLPPKSLPHPHGSQPTAMDFSPNGLSAALLTYRGVFLMKRGPGQSWLEAFQGSPIPLGAHALPQAEALAFDPSGKFVYFTSEGSNPKLQRWPVP
jgi:hypothetical protein